MRVLVVDDEPAVRQALERALRFEGYTAELAEDGMAGLAAMPRGLRMPLSWTSPCPAWTVWKCAGG